MRARHRTAIGSVLAAATLAVSSGCVALPQERANAGERWQPVTEAEMRAWVKSYDETNNQANADKDKRLIAQIEDGALLRVSQAGYTYAKRARKNTGDKPKKYEPFTHDEPTFYLPAFDTYPLWYLADTVPSNSDDKSHQLAVTAAANASADWRTVLSVPLGKQAELPRLEERAGAPVSVPSDDKERLGKSPRQLAQAFGDLLTSSAKRPPGANRFQLHKYVKNHLKWNRDEAKIQADGNATFSYEAKPDQVYALGTEDGGALLLFGVHEERNTYLSPNVTYTINSKKSSLRKYTGKSKATDTVRQSVQWQAALVVPPKGAKGEKIETLGLGYHWLEGSMD